jgi:hypothetical protein
MIVTRIRLEESTDHCLLTARVRHESGDEAETDLWFRFPAALRSSLTTAADPFFVALLLPAMVLEKRLVIEGDVCPRLLESSAQIQDIFASWVKNARQIPIQAGRRDSPILRPTCSPAAWIRFTPCSSIATPSRTSSSSTGSITR